FLVALTKPRSRNAGVVICRSHGWEHEDYRLGIRPPPGTPGRWRRGLLLRLVRLRMVECSVRLAGAVIVGASTVKAFAVQRGWKRDDRVFVVPCGIDPEYCVSE